MNWFRRRTFAPATPVERRSLPQTVLEAIPADQRGGPHERLEDGRFVIVGRDVVIVADDEKILDSGFWHEVQFAAWKADTRLFTLVWSQPGRPQVVGRTVGDQVNDLMEKISSRVGNTVVATRRFVTDSGTHVAASVRRRIDGKLFSAVVAGGPISEVDEEKAYRLEEELRAELNMAPTSEDRPAEGPA